MYYVRLLYYNCVKIVWWKSHGDACCSEDRGLAQRGSFLS